MRQKRVWRYYCDFCKKANCSKNAISVHESRCTLNPNRKCGMCTTAGHHQSDIAEIIIKMPRPCLYQEGDATDWLAWPPDVNEDDVLANLRKQTKNCPACILAVLRQAKIPVPMLRAFDYAAECKRFWADMNEKWNKETESAILAEMYGSTYA